MNWFGILLSVGLILVTMNVMVACSLSPAVSSDEIIAHLQQAQEQRQNMHAIIDMSISRAGYQEHLVMEQWIRPPDAIRVEYKAGPKEIVGQITVVRGNKVWVYNPNTNLYLQDERDQLSFTPHQTILDLSNFLTTLLNTMNLSYLGQEQMAGRDVYKLRATPKFGKERYGSTEAFTVWVDVQDWTVIALEGDLGERGRFAWRLRKLEYGMALPDSLFSIDIPPDAKRVRDLTQMAFLASDWDYVGTVEEAQRRVKFSILVPTKVPDGYTFVQAQISKERDTVILKYRLESPLWSKDLSVTEQFSPQGWSWQIGGKNVRRTTVRRHEAAISHETHLLGLVTWSALEWQEGQLRIRIFGYEGEDAIRRIAASLRPIRTKMQLRR